MTKEDVHDAGGYYVLENFYNNSLPRALATAYPELKWQAWRFKKMPNLFWRETKNLREYMEWVSSELGVLLGGEHHMKCSKSTVMSKLLKKRPKTLEASNLVRSEFPLFREFFSEKKPVSELQRRLQCRLQELGVKHMEVNYHHHGLRFPATNKAMELDVFVPDWNMGFEFQGKQHYTPMPVRMTGNEETRLMYDVNQMERDRQKREHCEKAGITLVEVPYWWDGSVESLAATIHKHR